MSETVSFIFVFPRLAIAYRVRILSCPQFDPSSLLPVWFNVQIHTEFLGLSVEVDLVIESICYLFIVTSRGVINLHSTNAHTKLKHFSSHFNLVGMRVFIDLQNGQVPLSHQEYN